VKATTKKLINKVLEKQVELKRKKSAEQSSLSNSESQHWSSVYSDSPNKLDDESQNKRKATLPVQKSNFSDSPKETIRRSQTGEEMHIVPFKKKELEDTSGIDHIPAEDDLGEIRHTKEYEEVIEKQHVSKLVPLKQLNSISETLTKKITSKRLIRSNSDELQLKVKSSQKEEIKRRNSLNKKLKSSEDTLLVSNFIVKGTTEFQRHNSLFDSPEKQNGNIVI
jgi:hypothetical protein